MRKAMAIVRLHEGICTYRAEYLKIVTKDFAILTFRA